MNLTRDLKFDGLKFFLIYCVVLGHLPFVDLWHVRRIIYSFHMPMFIFLSGYFTSLNPNREKQIKWIKKTIVIYIIAQLAQVLLELILEYVSVSIKGGIFNIKSLLNWSILVCPKFALWYLVCLIYWRFAYWRFCKKIKDAILFLISILLLIVAGFVPLGYEFSFQRAFAFSPFFILGVIVKKKQLLPIIEKIPISYAFILLLIGIISATQIPSYWPVNQCIQLDDLLLRLTQTSLGFLCVICILRLSRTNAFIIFSKWGSKTLWIYIGHTYLIIIGKRIISYLDVQINIIIAFILTIMCCAIIISIANLYIFIKDVRHN